MKPTPSPWSFRSQSLLGAAAFFTGWSAFAQPSASAGSAAAAAPYDLRAAIGPHHRIVETMVDKPDADGHPVQRLSRYTEVATGLNFLDANGAWQPTVEQISPHPEGAAALAGYYKVVFKRNINQSGAVRLITPDGKEVKNNPLGLFYVDRQSGQWVKLSGIQDSIGQIVGTNQVFYRNVGDSIRMDLRYTYQKGRFHADWILRETPRPPAAFNLSTDTSLEIITEFVGAPEPQQRPQVLRQETDATKRAAMTEPDITDVSLGFGELQMILGMAQPIGGVDGQPVAKQWLQAGTRRFLSERVEMTGFAGLANNLPAAAKKGQVVMGSGRSWPEAPIAIGQDSPMQQVSPGPDLPGVLIDYVTTVSSGTSITFASYNGGTGPTYRVSSAVNFSGTITFNSGAVLKYDSGGSLTAYGAVTGGGAILTSVSDNTAGDQILTGPPCGTYPLTALSFYTSVSGSSVSGMEIRYASSAVSVYAAANYLSVSFPSLRIISCSTGLQISSGPGSYVTITASNLYTCGVGNPTPTPPPTCTISTPSATNCGNTAPTVNYIQDFQVSIGDQFPFSTPVGVSDSESPYILSVSASSSNTAVVPNNASHLSVSGCGLYWTLNATPITTGQTTITVTASDGALQGTRSFLLTVNPVNPDQPPSIAAIPDYSTLHSTVSPTITAQVTDPDDPIGNVTVTASGPGNLVQPITVTGTGNTRSMQITPVTEVVGDAVITVTATDPRQQSTSTTFTLHIKSDHSNPDGAPAPVVGIGPGQNPGGGGGGGVYFGPGGIVDLNAIRNLEWDGNSTCSDDYLVNGFPAQPPDQTALFGTKDDACPVNVRYHVRFTVAADLPKGGATHGPGM